MMKVRRFDFFDKERNYLLAVYNLHKALIIKIAIGRERLNSIAELFLIINFICNNARSTLPWKF